MMDKNLAAFTPAEHPYPAYVSINERGAMVEITVRSPVQSDGRCGTVSAMSMTREEFKALLDQANVAL